MGDMNCTGITCLILLSLFVCNLASELVLPSRLGSVTGNTVEINGTHVRRFLGIPYAKPPVAELRFAKPVAYGSFPGGKLNATSFASACYQPPSDNANNAHGSEDCLFLNVYSPEGASNSTVLVWIHGGSFRTGSAGAYHPEALTAYEDVVVVTINYRLGNFGFLTTGDAELPGNYGLWDQKLAIEWVKNNIEDYGGDSNSITLFGESAGGMSVAYQMLSPKNDASLFQRGITESGVGFALEYFSRNPRSMAAELAAKVGCHTEQDLVKCLRAKTSQDLLNDALFFFPTIDNDFLAQDLGMLLGNVAQSDKFPNALELMGNFENYDLFSGWNDQEGLVFLTMLMQRDPALIGKDLTDGVTAEVLSAVLNTYQFRHYRGDSRTRKFLSDIFINYYLGTPDLLNSDDKTLNHRRLEIYTQIAGDMTLTLPTIQHLQLHSAFSNKTTFGYEFSNYRKTLNSTWLKFPDWLRTGADHFDEVAYVLGYPLLTAAECSQIMSTFNCAKYTLEEKELSRKMVNHWANFARTGNPSSKDYDRFEFPRNQMYTKLKTGAFDKLTHPLNDKQRLLAAITTIILQSVNQSETITTSTTSTSTTSTTSTPTNTPDSDPTRVKASFLNGMVALSPEEANSTLTALVVVGAILAVLVIVLFITIIVLECQQMKAKKKDKLKDEVPLTKVEKTQL